MPTPYTTARLMDLFSEGAGTLPFTTTRHPVAIPIPTLAMITAHQVGIAMEAISLRHLWQALIILRQTK